MGNQSFFSPKNKTRTWAFLHAHLGNGPLPPLAIKRAALYLKCTVVWGVHAKIPIQFNILKLLPLFSTSSRFQNLTLGWHFSISRPSLYIRLGFSVFSLSVYCFQFSVCLNAFSYSVLLGIVGPTPSTGSRLACLVLV